MRNRIAAGNWKMHKTQNEAEELTKALLEVEIPDHTEVILGVPYLYLSQIKGLVGNSEIKVVAQNCHFAAQGAHTGEISAKMLQSCQIDGVIIGHSERRAEWNETDELLAKKTDAALAEGLMVIFCCGEPLEVREAEGHISFVKSQLENGLFHLAEEQLSEVVIAYEPIWAIGTGVTASPTQAQEMHASIRSMVSNKYGESAANQMRILYGGSVKPGNAAELFSQKDVDGGLVGGASLKAEDFSAIIRA